MFKVPSSLVLLSILMFSSFGAHSEESATGPIISYVSGSGPFPIGTREVEIVISTDVDASCKASKVDNDVPSNWKKYLTSTDNRTHSVRTPLQNDEDTFRYIRCRSLDTQVVNTTSFAFPITFSNAQAIATPQNFSVDHANSTDGNFNLSWDAVSGISHYHLLEQNIQGVWQSITLEEGALSIDISRSEVGDYQYKIAACNDSALTDCGSFSDEIVVWVGMGEMGDAPVISYVSGSGPHPYGVDNIEMIISTNINASCRGNHLDTGTFNDWNKLFSTDDNRLHRITVPISGAGDTQKYIRCQANDSQETNLTSFVFPITVNAASSVGMPENFVANPVNNSGNYTLSWDPVPDAVTYLLKESTDGHNWDRLVVDASNVSQDFSKTTDGNYQYYLFACSDELGLDCGKCAAKLTVYVNGGSSNNLAPTITSEPLLSGAESVLYSYDVEATDPNTTDVLTFSLTNSPAGMVILSDSGVISWTPTSEQVGTHSITVSVADDAGLTDTQTFDLVIDNVNEAPSILSAAITQATQGASYVYQVEATDPDSGDSLTYSLTVAPNGMTIDSLTGTINWSPTHDQVSDHDVTIVVTDTAGLTATQIYLITVANVNDAPEFTSTPITTGQELVEYSYQLTASDKDNDSLTFESVTLPSGMSLSVDGLLLWTPSIGQEGAHDVSVSVTDPSLETTTQSFIIQVERRANTAPVADAQSLTVNEDTALSIVLIATDVDNDVLTYEVETNPTNGALTGTAPNLTYIPNANFFGSDSFTFKANDGIEDSVNATVTISIASVNDAPTVSAASYSTNEDSELTIELAGSDVENDVLTFEIVEHPSNGIITGTGSNITYTPNENFNGSDSFTFLASDGLLSSEIATITVESTSVNDVPVISSSPNTEATTDIEYVYQVIASDADFGDFLSYELLTAPEGMSVDEINGLITWTPLLSQTGTHQVSLSVKDLTGAEVLQTFDVVVTKQNEAPVITSSPVTSVSENSLYTYPVVAIDSDNDVINFSASSPLNWLEINSESGLLNWNVDDEFTGFLTHSDAYCSVADIDSFEIPVALDAVMVIDNSASNQKAWPWTGDALAFLDAKLVIDGVGSSEQKNNYGLVSFIGGPTSTLFDSGLLGSISEFSEAIKDTRRRGGGPAGTGGGGENPLKALQFTIDTFSFREDAAKSIIWIADEKQQGTMENGETVEELTDRLVLGGYNINLLTSITLSCLEDDRTALGVDANGVGFAADGLGGFEKCEVDMTPITEASDSYRTDFVEPYMNPTFAVGGMVWSLSSITNVVENRDISLHKALATRMYRTAISEPKLNPKADIVPISARVITHTDNSVSIGLKVKNRGLVEHDGQILLKVLDSTNNNIISSLTIEKLVAEEEQEVAVTLERNLIGNSLTFQIEESENTCNSANNTLITPFISVFASDENGGQVEQLFLLNVTEVNEPPSITSVPSTSVIVGQIFEYQLEVNDPDNGDSHRFDYEGNGSASIDKLGGLFKFQPTTDDIGIQEFTFSVSDSNGEITSQELLLTVTDSYTLPKFSEGPGYTRVLVGESFEYLPSVTSDSTSILSYQLISGPEGSSINANTGEVSWVAQESDIDRLRLFSLVVQDQYGNYDTLVFSVFGDTLNVPPKITSTANTIATLDTKYLYDLQYEDANFREDFDVELITTAEGIVSSIASTNDLDHYTANLTWSKFVIQGSYPRHTESFDYLCKDSSINSPVLGFSNSLFLEQPDSGAGTHLLVIPVLDTNSDGVISSEDNPSIVTTYANGYDLRAFDSLTGDEIWNLDLLGTSRVSTEIALASADINSDGVVDILAVEHSSQYLVAISSDDRRTLWKSSEPIVSWANSVGQITVVDLDNDGSLEVLAGYKVFDNNGDVVLTLEEPTTVPEGSVISPIYPIDIDADGSLEIFQNGKAYSLDGSIRFEINSSELGDSKISYAAFVNWDNDPSLEFIFVSRADSVDSDASINLIDDNGTLIWAPIEATFVGQPIVANFGINDGLQVFIPGQDVLLDSDGSELWSLDNQYSEDGSVAQVGDFQGDGRLEVIMHRRDTSRGTYVLDGVSGSLMDIINPGSNDPNFQAKPVIVDLDKNGKFEVISAYSRNIQIYSYTGPNVQENLTSTHYQKYFIENNLTSLFQANSGASDSLQYINHDQVMFDSKVQFVNGLPDLWVNFPQGNHKNEFSVRVKNRGTADLNTQAIVEVYAGDPNAGAELIGSRLITELAMAEEQSFSFTNIVPVGFVGEIVAKVSSVSGEEECHTINNIAASYTVDLSVLDYDGLKDTESFLLGIEYKKTATLTIGAVPVIEEGSLFEFKIEEFLREYSDITNSLVFSLDKGPVGASIDAETGLVSWIPNYSDSGTHTFQVSVRTISDNISSRVFNLTVTDVPNEKPVIISFPEEGVLNQNIFTYNVIAEDADGDTLTYSLVNSPVDMTIDMLTGVISWKPELAGSYPVEIIVSDGKEQTSQSFVLSVNDQENNLPPQIVSSPVSSAQRSALYNYLVEAVDADGDSLQFKLVDGPLGMSFATDTGLLSWTPSTDQDGVHDVELRVEDGRGGHATQSYSILVTSSGELSPLPKIISQPGFNAKIGFEYSYVLEVEDETGETLNFELQQAPEGMSISSSGQITWIPDLLTTASVMVRVSNLNGYVTQGWNIEVLPDNLEFTAELSISPQFADDGEEISVQVYPINAIGEVTATLELDGQQVELNSALAGNFTALGVGSHTLEATVSDQYQTVTITDSFYVKDPSDTTLPTVEITSPLNAANVTSLTEVTGSVQDDNLASWRLVLTEIGSPDDEFTTLAEGTANFDEGVISQFDPSLLMNGQYALILEATDQNGQVGNATSLVVVDGDLKVGNFSITLEDKNIPLAGLPIRVTRSYDSRRKNSNQDFGYGWRVGYQDISIQEAGEPTEGWEQFSSTSTFNIDGNVINLSSSCTYPLSEKLVTITLPNGDVESFVARARPISGGAVSISDPNCTLLAGRFITLSFDPRDGTDSELVSLDGQNLYLTNVAGGNLALDIIETEAFDVQKYQLTTRAGYIYKLDQYFGIETITDPNGNTITYSDDGIVHSSGKSVDFVRDSQGRITSITDPKGNVVSYDYNATGDLISSTDEVGNVTSYTYNSEHGLLDIIDPLGRTIVKNIYDDDGRLIAQEDNEGNRTDFVHNLAGRQSTVTDRLGRVTNLYYDDEGNVTSQVDALNNVTSFTFDSEGNQLSKTDALNRVTSATYNETDDQLTQTDALGEVVSFTYNDKGQELTVTDEKGNVFTNDYDAVGNLLSITDPQNNVVSNSINSQGLPLTVTDALNQVTSYTYDLEGNKLTETDPSGAVTSFTYDSNNNVLTQTLSRTLADNSVVDETVSYEYDSKDRIISTTDPLGNVTKTEFDLIGNEVAMVDALNRRTEMEYDAYGRLVKTIYPDSSESSKTYDAEGNLLTETDRNGNTTSFEYDKLNRLIKTTYADTSETSTEYDAVGQVVAEIDANGNRTTHEYDLAGRRIKTTDALLNEHQFAYDESGNLVSETDALNRTTNYGYDSLDRKVSTTFANLSSVLTGFDALARRTSATDQANVTTNYAYDEVGRLVSVTDVENNVTSYTYDEAGNKLTQTDAEARTTRWTYDALGRVLTRTLPMGQVESFTYDVVGNMLTRTDFNGDVVTYTYDVNNRVTQIDYASDSTTDSFTYDDNGNRLTAINAEGTWTYTYDSMNRLKTETQPNGEVLSYEYDSAGNKTQLKVTYADASTRTEISTYDVLNRLATVTDADGNITSYEYDAVGNRVSVTHSNANVTAYVYDELNRLTQLQDKHADESVFQQFDYQLHATGRREKITELSGRVSDYTYDSLYRLTDEVITDAVNGDYSASYSFDKVGNRVASTINGVSTVYTYDDNDRLTQEGGEVYSYDDNGNTLSKTIDSDITTYTYDSRQKLIFADIFEGGVSKTANYRYNVDGIRTQKIDDGVETNYLVDSNRDYAQVIAETDSTNTIAVEYIFGDDLLAQKRGSTLSNYQYDGLGSTRALTDSTGNVSDEYFYDAFGVELARTGTTDNDYLFTGEQYDAGLGNYYLRARYYDQGIGRFTQQDTWMGRNHDPVTLHKYLYANADPVSYTDPTGNFSIGSLMSAVNTAATLVTVAETSYSIGGVLYGSVVNDEPLEINSSTVKQVGFAVLFSSSAGKIMKYLARNPKYKKLFKLRTLYRGVNKDHDNYGDALRGFVPGGWDGLFMSNDARTGAADQHNQGVKFNTPFSSWSARRAIAKTIATRATTSNGVVIRAKIMSFRIFKSPDRHGIFDVENLRSFSREHEFLVVGPVQGIPSPAGR